MSVIILVSCNGKVDRIVIGPEDEAELAEKLCELEAECPGAALTVVEKSDWESMSKHFLPRETAQRSDKPRMVIVNAGGVVAAVAVDKPVEVMLIDFDNIAAGDSFPDGFNFLVRNVGPLLNQFVDGCKKELDGSAS
jgi:hypothetical protein